METENNEILKQALISRSDGVTPAERYLKKLCEHSFLTLWSYPGIYRDQGMTGNHQEGKEVCDLLVVFQNQVIIFSDKDCMFPNTGKPDTDWLRWYRKAIKASEAQIWGAERWIRNSPNLFYLDRACTQPFPISIPSSETAKIHRVVVAHGASDRCKKELGGSGSLKICPQVIAKVSDSEQNADIPPIPFSTGIYDPDKGFVHVFDDVSLDIVMNTLDTITDFVSYLSKKEELICSGRLAEAAGEEDLLAHYLMNVNDKGDHDFTLPPGSSHLNIEQGLWESFRQSPQRNAQQEADDISYEWDHLIAKCNTHVINDTLVHNSFRGFSNLEKALRLLAREPRLRRRMLAQLLFDLILVKTKTGFNAAVLEPSSEDDPYFVLAVFPRQFDKTEREYQLHRSWFLGLYCKVVKLKYPQAKDIVGIATESGVSDTRSEDFIYRDVRVWTADDQEEAARIQEKYGILKKPSRIMVTELEYPEVIPAKSAGKESDIGQPDGYSFRKVGRNEPCPCRSGKKYKRCHGM
jgi:hypothetical protein